MKKIDANNQRELGNVPWHQRPFVTVQTASQVAGLSRPSLYSLEKAGRVTFRRLAGRTLVTTESLVELIESAEEWTPSKAGNKATIARIARATSSWKG